MRIDGTNDADVLDGTPEADEIFGLDGDDLISGAGGNDDIWTWSGNDTLNGNEGDDTLRSGHDDDKLYGGQGDDVLDGQQGDDTLIGGLGKNSLTGGYGIDWVSYAWMSTPMLIDLSARSAVTLGSGEIGDTVRVENVEGSSGADTIIGASLGNSGHAYHTRPADNWLSGGKGRDSIYGGDGDDTLDGGGHTDFLDGGDGFDIVLYTQNQTSVRVDLNAQRVSFPGKSWSDEELVSIEGAETGSGNDTLLGDGKDNVLRGNAGSDTLRGAQGDDTLDGGEGNDKLTGGGGFDIVDYSGFSTGMRIDLRRNKVRSQEDDAYLDTLKTVEGAIGGSADDNILGDGGDNLLQGGAGNDVLKGLGGDDTLAGWTAETRTLHSDYEAGITPDEYYEMLASIEDNDVIDGGGGTDTVYYHATVLYDYEPLVITPKGGWRGGIDVNADLTTNTVTGNGWTDTLVSIENITTGGGDDTVSGDPGDNVLIAGDGANLVRGGNGEDVIHGGLYSHGGSRGGDTLIGGPGDDIIYGNGSIGREQGASRATDYRTTDSLEGRGGNDTLVAGVGDQVMTGGSGADEFRFSDEQFYFDDWDFFYMIGQNAVITDFAPDSGDTLVIEANDRPGGGTATFVGEADPDDLDFYEVGFERVVGDTIVTMRYEPVSDDDVDNDFVSLTVELEGYTGALTGDHIILV